jgi:hypothetical protein
MSSKGTHLRLVGNTDNFYQNVWRQGDLLVAHRHALFPDNCIICNQPANSHSAKKMVFWHTPMLLPILLLSLPFYVVFALIFKRTLRLEVPLCSRHYWQRNILTFVGVCLVPISIWMIYIAISMSKPPLILSGILTIIVGGLLTGWARNPIWATRIRGDFALIRGINSKMLDDLPDWKGDPW